MFAKSILFTSLLVCSFSVFVNAKNSDVPDPDSNFTSVKNLNPFDPPSALDFNSDYSSSENQQDDFEDESFFSRIPTESERDEIVKASLSSFEISATQDLIEGIVELTDGYSISQIVELTVDMINTSTEKNELNPFMCARKLEEAINILDFGYTKEQKINRLKKITHKLLFPPIPFDPDLFRPKPEKEFLDEYTKKGFNEEEEDISFEFPTPDERLNVIKEILHKHNKSASEFFIQKMVEYTSGFETSVLKGAITAMIEESQTGYLDQDRYLKYPTENERRNLIKEILLLTQKFASDGLLEEIVALTNHFDIPTITKLVESVAKKSKTDSLDQNNCRATLRKAIDLLDKEEIKEYKLAQIKLWNQLNKLKDSI